VLAAQVGGEVHGDVVGDGEDALVAALAVADGELAPVPVPVADLVAAYIVLATVAAATISRR